MEDKGTSKVQLSKTVFISLVVLAFILSSFPLISLLGTPFSWMMTFFHEISHGIAAIVTGGSISKIELNLDGSGLITYHDGIRVIVAFAGYSGAVLCGMAIYISASTANKKHADGLALFLAIIVIGSAVLWARDLVTWIIMGVMSGVLISIIKLNNSTMIQFLMKFIGIYVLLDAVSAPLHLIDGSDRGDGADLADITFIPEIIWVGIWVFCGLFGLYYLWKKYH